MTATVLEFRHPLPRPKQQVVEERYFCSKCTGDEFHLSPIGAIKCVKCGTHMKNLLVTGV